MTESVVSPVVLDGKRMRDWAPEGRFAVTREALARYASVTRDPIKAHQLGEKASPAYAFVPFTDLLFKAVDELVGSDEPPKVVHTHQDFHYQEPIRAGDDLTLDARVIRLEPGPFGAVLEVVSTATRADGTPVNRQTGVIIVVGAEVVNPLPGTTPDPGAGRSGPEGIARSVALTVDPDHPARYAEASGDTNPIHLDAEFARATGFPNVIAHGMLTLALTVSAIQAEHLAHPVAHRLAIEFTRPVFPGDRLTVRWSERRCPAGVDVAFEVHNRRRRVVLRGGLLTLGAS